MIDPVVTAIRVALAAPTDPARAVQMQAYMKSQMPFRGLRLPQVRALVRATAATWVPVDRDAWERTARTLWDDADFREERYASLELLGLSRFRPFRTDPDSLELYRHLVVTGAWWDTVDAVAAHLVGPLLLAHPAQITAVMRHWAESPDMWIRRTAIICQLQARHRTDLSLLEDAIAPNLEGSPFGSEFFIRKAIGWALRQYARTDSAWVAAYVAQHQERLSGLSVREATKHLPKHGTMTT